jgi:hypothetical protein
MNAPHSHAAAPLRECQKTRLAEGSVASVDLSDCGVIYVHLAAITIRLSPQALSELVSTLGEAVALHTCQQASGEGPFEWLRRVEYES